MLKTIRRLQRYQKELEHGLPGVEVFTAENDIHLDQARKLHASVYIEREYIDASQLDENGHIASRHDPHSAFSRYFVVVERTSVGERVVATARQIEATEAHGHNSFPTIEKLPIEQSWLSKIKNYPPGTCVEISGLAKIRGFSSYSTMLLYRAMWQHSIASGHKVWIMACDSHVYSNLKSLFKDAFVEIGSPVHYMGSEVIPAALFIEDSRRYFDSQPRTLNPIRRKLHKSFSTFFLKGLSQ